MQVKNSFQEIQILVANMQSVPHLTGFFNNTEEGIILEDDDLPDQSFFLFVKNCLKNIEMIQNYAHIWK